jgi:hypothetical protein
MTTASSKELRESGPRASAFVRLRQDKPVAATRPTGRHQKGSVIEIEERFNMIQELTPFCFPNRLLKTRTEFIP